MDRISSARSIQQPVVSFVVLTYKQERFVVDAVRSALAQTYRPLQIVISDDCSPDRTFQLAESVVAEYQGPHDVTLGRTATNLGVAGNLNHAWNMSVGELLVLGAGDDVSVADRTEKLVTRWLDTKRQSDLVCSYFSEIDEQGRETGFIKTHTVFVPNEHDDILKWRCGATGACAAYSRTLFEKYGPLGREVISEDWVLSFRAWLEGGISLVPEPLVLHRTHAESISVIHRSVNAAKDRRRRLEQRRSSQGGALASAEEWLKAWRIARRCDGKGIERELERLVRLRRSQLGAFDATMIDAVRSAAGLARDRAYLAAAKLCVRHVLRLY